MKEFSNRLNRMMITFIIGLFVAAAVAWFINSYLGLVVLVFTTLRMIDNLE